MDEEGLSGVNQRRSINPVDVLAFGGIVLLFVVLTIGIILTPQNWPPAKIAVLIAVDVLALGITVAYFIRKWMKFPDFVTSHGTAFWINGIHEINLPLMERALGRFLDVMLEERPEISQAQLKDLLVKTGVEWKKGRVSLITSRWELRDKAGIQYGYRLLVQWRGSVAESALYHELLHEVNQFIRRPSLAPIEQVQQFDIDDIQHKEADWWRLEGVLADDF